MKTLETERLILRDWEKTDLDDLFKLWSNPNVTIPEGSLPKKTREECIPTFNYFLKFKNNYAVVYKSTETVIGSIGLNEDGGGIKDALNMGFILNESYWNQGIITEACKTIIANAFEFSPIITVTHAIDNKRTEHIVKKLGFTYVKTLRNIKMESCENPSDYLYYKLDLK